MIMAQPVNKIKSLMDNDPFSRFEQSELISFHPHKNFKSNLPADI